jgi:hypothetical protein
MSDNTAVIENYGEDPLVVGWTCPGCGFDHCITVDPSAKNTPIWSFNGDYTRPTFSPSILVTFEWGKDRVKKVCHFFVKDGIVDFLNDCTHELKGTQVALPSIQ